ncbi:MAG: hypothetical protein COB56_05650 [Robiginitomaculum sp.]|nr:MAG: hypothetical protein COB56_05650 [Robiginitomaculum sp.]
MKRPFYLNPDVLEKKWLSREDFFVFAIVLISGVLAVMTYLAISASPRSPYAAIGAAAGYGGGLIGLYLHLNQQTKKMDEFTTKIFNQAIAQAGLSTLIIIAIITLYSGVTGGDPSGIWTLVAPVMFIGITWKRVRIISRAYASLTV